MDGSSKDIQFSWGRRRGKGGAKMDTQFYDSFTFDNVKYSLYDCVYLFKNGDPDPYIGKIIKMWQQNQTKKVKILWFFLPDEIQNYLRDPVMENEIFLASGEGMGLTDINPLEAIAGKCSIVCISKDERNRQPSPREQAMSDYIFYRIFDVENCTLSDQLPEKIAGLEVKVLLNPKDEQVTSCLDQAVCGMDQKVHDGPVVTPSLTQSVVKEDQSPNDAVSIPQLAVKEDESAVAAATFLQSIVKEEQSSVAAAPLLQSMAKEEEENPIADNALHKEAVKQENVRKPTHNVSKPTQSALKRTHKDLCAERPPKKLKFSQDVIMHDSDAPGTTVRPGTLDLNARGADRSKWFKIPWDVRLRSADEQGTLVYIQNLDTQFGPADIEELIRQTVQLSCTAKPIRHTTYDDPNNGKAYAIFKTKGEADAAVSKINSGLVVNGRPLYCSKGSLKVPKPSEVLVGHLTINNIRINPKARDEQKKAVSTSHCSQPNTMEYDLALDWMLVREKQERKFRILQKKHREETRTFTINMEK